MAALRVRREKREREGERKRRKLCVRFSCSAKERDETEGGRQKPITEVKIIQWMNQQPEEFCVGEMLRNYKRNEMLIDLSKIPNNLQESILDKYESVQPKTRQVFMNYMINNRLKNLIEVIDEF